MNEKNQPSADAAACAMLPCIWDFSDKQDIQVTVRSLSRALSALAQLGYITIHEAELAERVDANP